MKLTDLLGRDVVTTAGAHLGKVHDALLVQDGPPASPAGAHFRLHALAVGRRSVGTRLGYAQGHVDRPRLLKWLFGSQVALVPWSTVVTVDIDDNRIIVSEPEN
jgi:hypothetical protein